MRYVKVAPPSSPSQPYKIFRRTVQATLLLPAIAFAHFAQAEAGAEIDQDGGSSNEALITQIDAQTAYAHILQDGHDNLGTILQVRPVDDTLEATITQYGSTNEAHLEQTDSESTTADVLQGGESNFAQAQQNGAIFGAVSFQQSGDTNVGYIYQEGNATAEIEQVGHGHFAEIEQRVELLYGHTASVYQEGSYNSISVLQEGNNQGEVITHQIGNNNIMTVSQSWEGDPPIGMNVTLTTEGDDNVVNVVQDGFQNQFTMTQIGDGNTVDAYQDGGDITAMLISRNSNYNADTIMQDNELGSHVWIERHDTDNSSSTISLSGNFTTYADIYQLNSDSVGAVVNQESLISGQATVRQSMADNSNATVMQSAAFEVSADIEQEMTSVTTATVTQHTGEDLIASIYQSNGSDLVATIEQSGSRNEARIMQVDTSGVEAHIAQHGSDSFVEIIQHCETNSGNTIMIDQTGDGYSAAVSQGGTNNFAAITQM